MVVDKHEPRARRQAPVGAEDRLMPLRRRQVTDVQHLVLPGGGRVPLAADRALADAAGQAVQSGGHPSRQVRPAIAQRGPRRRGDLAGTVRLPAAGERRRCLQQQGYQRGLRVFLRLADDRGGQLVMPGAAVHPRQQPGQVHGRVSEQGGQQQVVLPGGVHREQPRDLLRLLGDRLAVSEAGDPRAQRRQGDVLGHHLLYRAGQPCPRGGRVDGLFLGCRVREYLLGQVGDEAGDRGPVRLPVRDRAGHHVGARGEFLAEPLMVLQDCLICLGCRDHRHAVVISLCLLPARRQARIINQNCFYQ